ncbi:MAG: hypothetical protein KGI52_12060 [Burkholderiales bacterium]|nr:hypothetical protein [Burkholderiales bacterium]
MISLVLSGRSASITFEDIEIPQRITWGGEQLLSVHQLMGGRRIVDALGASDAPLSWEGIFTTLTAVDRARFCDSLRRTGEACTLEWGEFSYSGVVSQFSADYTRGGLYVPYRITLTVVEDRTSITSQNVPPSPLAQMTIDLNRAGTLQHCIGDTSLAGLTATVQTAVQSVVSAISPMARGLTSLVASVSDAASCAVQIVNQGVAQVQSALVPIAQAQAQAQVLITSAEQAITGVVTAGGLLPGNPLAQLTGNAIAQVNAAVTLPPLYEYLGVMGRMKNNLNVFGAQAPSTKRIQVGGGTLQQVAAQQYGDATLWPVIAQANGLTDPTLNGIVTLTIPPAP